MADDREKKRGWTGSGKQSHLRRCARFNSVFCRYLDCTYLRSKEPCNMPGNLNYNDERLRRNAHDFELRGVS